MASAEHCLFCFEVLAAHLEDRDPLSLAEVSKTYLAYSATAKLTKQSPAVRRLATDTATASPSSSAASSTTSLGADTAATTPAEDGDGASPRRAAAPAVSPLFVTWNTLRRGSAQLRGCIGTFEPQPLEDGLASYALTSALHDSRFDPIGRAELPSLEVAVTLLTDFEDAAGPDDWVLGRHGLRISFHHNGRRYGATYLPDVAPEQGWTKEETLFSLMRKAGWAGRRDSWRDVDLKVVRYQGHKESLPYAEYKAWRDWVDKNHAGSAS